MRKRHFRAFLTLRFQVFKIISPGCKGTSDIILYLMGFREACGSLLIVTGGCDREVVDASVCVLASAGCECATFILFFVSH